VPIIGVTGHRILTDIAKIEAGVEQAIDRIKKAFPREPLTCLSALAEGADTVVAKKVMARSLARLTVILPLHEDDYISDFRSTESKEEFLTLLGHADEVIRLPASESRDEAYQEAGFYVLNHCDALITVWDGQNAQGRGGTGEIVALARSRRLPIAWVKAGNRRPGTTEATSLGEDQGKVVSENF
jgi:hypothetical protein